MKRQFFDVFERSCDGDVGTGPSVLVCDYNTSSLLLNFYIYNNVLTPYSIGCI